MTSRVLVRKSGVCPSVVGIVRNRNKWAVKNVVPVTIGVATGAEFVSLNLLTITWMYTL